MSLHAFILPGFYSKYYFCWKSERLHLILHLHLFNVLQFSPFTFCLLYHILYYSLLLLYCCILIILLHHNTHCLQDYSEVSLWGHSDDITTMWCFPFYILSIFTFDLLQMTADMEMYSFLCYIYYSIDPKHWNMYILSSEALSQLSNAALKSQTSAVTPVCS